MGEPSYFVDSGGAVVPVAPEQAAGVAQLGWIPASPKQVADLKLQQKYGGSGQAALAGLESGASALTLGLSTVAERALGVPAEDIAGREQANPLASGVGTAAGIAAPLLLTGGTSALAKAAGATAPALLARTGQAVARGVTETLPAATSAIGRVAAKAAALGAGSAVEGAFYGAGQVVHEAALGDPQLTGESALATVGLSSFLGGALGGGAGLLGGAIKEATPKDFARRVSVMLEEAEAHSNLNATNAMPQKIKDTLRSKGSSIALEARDLGIIRNPLTDSADAILERARDVAATAGQEMDKIASGASKGAIASWEQISNDVRAPIIKALRSQVSTHPLADQFEGLMNRAGEVYGGRSLSVGDLWALRKDLGDFMSRNGRDLNIWTRDVNEPVMRVYGHVDQIIEKGIREETGPAAVKAWRDATRASEVGITFRTLAESGVERSGANNLFHLSSMLGTAGAVAHAGPLGALAAVPAEIARRRGASAMGWAARGLRDALSGSADAVAGKSAEAIAAARKAGSDTLTAEATRMPEAVVALSALEKQRAAVTGKIESGVDALLAGGAKAGRAARAESEAGAARGLHAERVEHISRLANDPEQLHQALTAMTDGVHEHAPRTAQAAQLAAARAVAFLASKAPPSGPPAPLAAAPPPSSTDVARFARYFDAVNDPISVLHAAGHGTMTPEGLEAITAVYPAILGHVRSTITGKLAEHSGHIPYHGRLGISALMGQDMDGSIKTTGRNQMSYAQPMAAPPKATPARAGKLNVAQRAMTPAQQSAGRR